jgi:hypothetical protein
MTSAAKAVANRANAQASTGPRTPEGKAATRLNAVAHGLTSKSIVLPHESQEEYDEVHQSLIDAHRPATSHETLLIERVAQAHWRLQRCLNVERAFLENRIDAAREESPDIDPDAAMANLFVDKAESSRMRLVMRYLAAAERAFYKAMADLNKAQADRRKREYEEAQMQAYLSACENTPEQSAAAGGFVSQAASASPSAISFQDAQPPANPALHAHAVGVGLPRVA